MATRQEPVRISSEAYVSPAFAAREKAKLWPKAWQVACREHEIPNPGDYLVYDVADESVIIVRGRDGSIRAHHNACPHRGRQIMEGCGHAANFRCQYHNWTFDLEGRNIVVQDRDDWCGALDREDIDLKPVRTGTWAGFVWINFDEEAESLAAFLDPVPGFLDPYEMENLRYRWSLRLRLPCNWKVAQEAFMEGYHLAATHTQLLPTQGDDYTRSYARGKHSHFGHWEARNPPGTPSPRLKMDTPADIRPGVLAFFTSLEDTFKAIITDRDVAAAHRILDEVPADADALTAFGAAVEFGRAAAVAEGADYPPNLTYDVIAASGVGWSIFPNSVVLPYYDGAVWYRARPDGDSPDRCIFDIWSFKRFAPGKEPAVEHEVHDTIDGKSFGLIIDQDLRNMEKVQKGMKSAGFSSALPNPVQEVEIIHFHRVLSEYLE